MKKFVACALLGFMLSVLLYMPAVSADPVNTDLIITGYNTPSVSQYTSSFNVSFTLENKSGEALSNVYLIVQDTSSYHLSSSGSKIPLDDIAMDGTCPVSLKFTYSGGSSTTIPIKIQYKKGETLYEVNEYLGIKVVTETIDPTPSLPDDTSGKKPRLEVVGGEMPVVSAGETVVIPVTLTNKSTYAAKNIYVKPVLGGSIPFTFTEFSVSEYISRINSTKKETVEFTFNVNANAEEGVYQLPLEVRYENSYKDSYSGDLSVNIRVVNNNVPPKLVLKDLNCNPQEVAAGDEVDLEFVLENIGTLAAKDVEVTLEGLQYDGIYIANGTNSVYITEVAGQQVETDEETAEAEDEDSNVESSSSQEEDAEPNNQVVVQYHLSTSEDMAGGGHGLTLKIAYKDRMKQEYVEEQKVFISVLGDGEKKHDDGEDKSVPKIIVGEYSTSPSLVRVARNFDLKLSFLNTHKAKTVKNIKVFLTVNETEAQSGNVFTPVNSSNTLYIDEIAPKEAVEQHLLFNTIPVAKPRTYNVTVNLEYEDEDGNQFTATELIGIPVVQEPKIEVGELSLPPQAFVGEPVSIFTEFYNMGQGAVRNLMVKVDGDFDAQESTYFVGNFDSGNSDYFETTLFPMSEGEIPGAIVFAFDDAAGDHHEIRKEFAMTIMGRPEPKPMPDGGKMEPPMPPVQEKEGFGKKVVKILKNHYVWMAVALIITAIVAFKLGKRHMQIKEMTLDD